MHQLEQLWVDAMDGWSAHSLAGWSATTTLLRCRRTFLNTMRASRCCMLQFHFLWLNCGRSLAGNRITWLAQDTFNSMSNLTELYLGSNNITYISMHDMPISQLQILCAPKPNAAARSILAGIFPTTASNWCCPVHLITLRPPSASCMSEVFVLLRSDCSMSGLWSGIPPCARSASVWHWSALCTAAAPRGLQSTAND